MAETDVPTPFKVGKIHPQMVSRERRGHRSLEPTFWGDRPSGHRGRRNQSSCPCRK